MSNNYDPWNGSNMRENFPAKHWQWNVGSPPKMAQKLFEGFVCLVTHNTPALTGAPWSLRYDTFERSSVMISQAAFCRAGSQADFFNAECHMYHRPLLLDWWSDRIGAGTSYQQTDHCVTLKVINLKTKMSFTFNISYIYHIIEICFLSCNPLSATIPRKNNMHVYFRILLNLHRFLCFGGHRHIHGFSIQVSQDPGLGWDSRGDRLLRTIGCYLSRSRVLSYCWSIYKN